MRSAQLFPCVDSSRLRTLVWSHRAFLSPRRYFATRTLRSTRLRRHYQLAHRLNDAPTSIPSSEQLWREDLVCQATQVDEASQEQSDPEQDVDPGFVGKLIKMLGNVGMGRRSVWEGGVGAFLLGGALLAVGLVSWVRGTQLKQGKPYTVMHTHCTLQHLEDVFRSH